MPRERKWGAFSITEALDEAFENGKSEIETLFDEMDEWRSNMEQSEGLSQTQKYEEVEECADTLERAKDALESVELELGELSLAKETVAFTDIKKRGCPRHVRCTNAVNRLEAVKAHLQNAVENEEDEEKVEKLEEQVEYIEEATGELESVNFPGMF